jgi:hypothetical protein
MTEQELFQLRYPIGKFAKPSEMTADLIKSFIKTIEVFPSKLRMEVRDLTDEQLDTAYRPEGWTVRQVVHHCADSHINSFMRFKLALTEDKPSIKPYEENLWAELPDSKSLPVEPSLILLEGLHQRWTFLLKSLNQEDFSKTFVHPEHRRIFRLDENLSIYAWHCNHHLAHITSVKINKQWK